MSPPCCQMNWMRKSYSKVGLFKSSHPFLVVYTYTHYDIHNYCRKTCILCSSRIILQQEEEQKSSSSSSSSSGTHCQAFPVSTPISPCYDIFSLALLFICTPEDICRRTYRHAHTHFITLGLSLFLPTCFTHALLAHSPTHM